jgi:hypothetical protein
MPRYSFLLLHEDGSTEASERRRLNDLHATELGTRIAYFATSTVRRIEVWRLRRWRRSRLVFALDRRFTPT